MFFQVREAGWQKAQGIAEVEPLGQVLNAIALVKRQTLRLSPTPWAAERFTNTHSMFTPQALCFRLLRRLKAKVLKNAYRENTK